MTAEPLVLVRSLSRDPSVTNVEYGGMSVRQLAMLGRHRIGDVYSRAMFAMKEPPSSGLRSLVISIPKASEVLGVVIE